MTSAQLRRFLPKIRFEERDEDFGECWIWTAAMLSNGYGYFALSWRPSNNTLAHRAAYEHFVGPIPEGLEIDHLCRNRACVNPRHLEAVTASVNVQRGLAPIHMAAVGRGWKGVPRIRTEEHNAKLRAICERNHRQRVGARVSAATKARCAAARRAWWAKQTPDQRDAYHAKRKATRRPMSDAAKQRIAEAKRAWWARRREQVA